MKCTSCHQKMKDSFHLTCLPKELQFMIVDQIFFTAQKAQDGFRQSFQEILDLRNNRNIPQVGLHANFQTYCGAALEKINSGSKKQILTIEDYGRAVPEIKVKMDKLLDAVIRAQNCLAKEKEAIEDLTRFSHIPGFTQHSIQHLEQLPCMPEKKIAQRVL